MTLTCHYEGILPALCKQPAEKYLSPFLPNGIRGLLDMLYARSLTRRLRGAMSALRAFPRVFKP